MDKEERRLQWIREKDVLVEYTLQNLKDYMIEDLDLELFRSDDIDEDKFRLHFMICLSMCLKNNKDFNAYPCFYIFQEETLAYIFDEKTN